MVIGVSGKIGSGKDAFTNRFIRQYRNARGVSFKNKKFGYNVKKLVSDLTGLPMRVMLSRDGKLVYLPDWGMTVGTMQQKMGTDAVRNNIHGNAWVLSLFAKYKDSEDFWIISDVRFKNEAKIIKDKGGILIRLNGDPAKCRENDPRDMNHQSETDLDDYKDWDYVLENKPPISNLDNFIKQVISNLK